MTSGFLRRIFYGTVVVASLFGWFQLASAAVISGALYESFNYAPGSQVSTSSGLNGGSGWNSTGDFNLANAVTSQWGDPSTGAPGNTNGLAGGSAAAKTIAAGTLSYSGATGYPIMGQGNRFDMNAALANQSNNIGRPLGGQTIDSGTTYFSFLVRKNTPDSIRTYNLAFFNTNSERFAVGQIGTSSGNTGGNIALLMNNQNPAGLVQAATPIASGTGITHLIIGRIDWNAGGNETVSLWVDPTDVTTEVAAGPVYVSTSGFELTALTGIRPFVGNNATIAGFNATAVDVDFDEIRLGGSWASVTTDPLPIVPEPGTCVLVTLAGVVCCFGLRRRKA